HLNQKWLAITRAGSAFGSPRFDGSTDQGTASGGNQFGQQTFEFHLAEGHIHLKGTPGGSGLFGGDADGRCGARANALVPAAAERIHIFGADELDTHQGGIESARRTSSARAVGIAAATAVETFVEVGCYYNGFGLDLQLVRII